jgi:hypothetical protein
MAGPYDVNSPAFAGVYLPSGTVGGSSFVRPANTTAYASGQLVANSTTAGSVVPVTAALARQNAGSGLITGVRLSKTSNGITGASFRVHFFKSLPTVTVGDGGVLATAYNGIAAIEIGYADVTMDMAYSDGAKGFAGGLKNSDGTFRQAFFDTNAGTNALYALVEARGAYTPVSGETFTVAVEAARQ